LEEVPTPTPTEDQVLIQVYAAGVNFSDILITNGRYNYKPPLPFTPGFEVAGRIVAVGKSVSPWKGKREMILSRCRSIILALLLLYGIHMNQYHCCICEALAFSESRLARTVRHSRMAAGDRFPQDAAQRGD
jgi:NADPH:quinone reductase-like Zn-dependent oxidoreductase